MYDVEGAAGPPEQTVVGRTLDVDVGVPPASLKHSVAGLTDVKSSESDSTMGDETASLTTSLGSSVTDYRIENGRSYHAYHEGAYYLPNDELERDRLDLQHHIWRMTLNGALYLSPIAENVENVLDVGTGTGIWAIEFAQDHPNTQVVGVDLSPIQPPFVPPNCTFIIDNAEEDWLYDRKFDFVHARMLILGIHDWPKFFKQAFDNMRPGGWLEVQELQIPALCDDGSATDDSPFLAWAIKVAEASKRVGLDPGCARNFAPQLRAQGFVNIRHETVKWAMGSWPRGKLEKDIGKWTLENAMQGLQGISMALFTRHMGMSREAVEMMLVDVRKQMVDPKSHVYLPVHIYSVQKPFEPTPTDATDEEVPEASATYLQSEAAVSQQASGAVDAQPTSEPVALHPILGPMEPGSKSMSTVPASTSESVTSQSAPEIKVPQPLLDEMDIDLTPVLPDITSTPEQVVSQPITGTPKSNSAPDPTADPANMSSYPAFATPNAEASPKTTGTAPIPLLGFADSQPSHPPLSDSARPATTATDNTTSSPLDTSSHPSPEITSHQFAAENTSPGSDPIATDASATNPTSQAAHQSSHREAPVRAPSDAVPPAHSESIDNEPTSIPEGVRYE